MKWKTDLLINFSHEAEHSIRMLENKRLRNFFSQRILWPSMTKKKKSLALNLYFKALHHLSNRNLAHQAWNCFECLWPWRCCHICNSRKHYAEMPQKCYLSPNFNLLDNSPVCKRIFPPAILDAKSKTLLTIFPKAMILEFSTCCIFQNKKYLQNLPS